MKFFKISNFQFPIFKIYSFKNTTNSFKYSLVQNFLKPIFSKVITGGKGGIFFENFSQFFWVYIPPYLGCGGYIIRATPTPGIW